MPRAAYVDESFHEHPTEGFYVLSAGVFGDDSERAREAMLALRGKRRTNKLHWREMDERDQKTAVTTVADLAGVHLVTVGSPVPPRRQERARRMCLRRLAFELHELGVTHVWMESRGPHLDRRDVDLIRDTRYDLPKGTQLRVEHVRGADEPLFWVADIVAGAVRAHRRGTPLQLEHLGILVRVIEVSCE